MGFDGFTGSGADGAQARAGREQAGSLAVDQLEVIGFGDGDFADALQLQQFAFDHHLREADEQVEGREITFAHGHLKGLHVEPVACEHGGVVSPHHVDRRAAAAGFREIYHVVMNQRGGVDHLYHRRHADHHRIHVAQHAPGKEHQDGPQTLASAGLQVLVDVIDGFDGGDRFQADLPLHFFEVLSHQIENFERREGLADFAECHGDLSV